MEFDVVFSRWREARTFAVRLAARSTCRQHCCSSLSTRPRTCRWVYVIVPLYHNYACTTCIIVPEHIVLSTKCASYVRTCIPCVSLFWRVNYCYEVLHRWFDQQGLLKPWLVRKICPVIHCDCNQPSFIVECVIFPEVMKMHHGHGVKRSKLVNTCF